jgi:DinB superfamily
MNERIELLLAIVDQAYERKAWHGTNLRGSLRRVTAGEAAWRAEAGRHNIWEVAVHCAYWKYAVRRRLLGEKRGSFPMKGSNWFAIDGGDEKSWAAARSLLDEQHRLVREAIATLPPKRLGERSGSWVITDLIHGIAAHDLYHAGQIQLLKRLRKRSDPSRG